MENFNHIKNPKERAKYRKWGNEMVFRNKRPFKCFDEYKYAHKIYCKPKGQYYVHEEILDGDTIALLVHPSGEVMGRSDTRLAHPWKLLDKMGVTRLLFGRCRYDLKIEAIRENAKRLEEQRFNDLSNMDEEQKRVLFDQERKTKSMIENAIVRD